MPADRRLSGVTGLSAVQNAGRDDHLFVLYLLICITGWVGFAILAMINIIKRKFTKNEKEDK